MYSNYVWREFCCYMTNVKGITMCLRLVLGLADYCSFVHSLICMFLGTILNTFLDFLPHQFVYFLALYYCPLLVRSFVQSWFTGVLVSFLVVRSLFARSLFVCLLLLFYGAVALSKGRLLELSTI